MSGVEILSVIEEPILLFNEEAFGITLFITSVIFFLYWFLFINNRK